MQRVGNDLNAFAYFSAGVVHSLQPDERFAFSLIVSDVTAIVSALMLDALPNKPEVLVNWQTSPPTVTTVGTGAPLNAVTGSVADLGGGAYRMYLEVENTTASAIDVTPIFYVTRGIGNLGLDVGMYAGSAMAGNGHLGNGFTVTDSIPGSDPVAGFDPGAVFEQEDEALLDLRPVPGSVLETAAPVAEPNIDLYGRYRMAPETIGAVALNAVEPITVSDLAVGTSLDAAHALDEAEVLTAFANRTVLPDGPSRVVNV